MTFVCIRDNFVNSQAKSSVSVSSAFVSGKRTSEEKMLLLCLPIYVPIASLNLS